MSRYKYTYKYVVDSTDLEDSFEFSSNLPDGWGDTLAAEAAEDYHSNHDGWESSWPLEITVADIDGKVIGTFSVDRDVEPVFSAREIKLESK
jgi:hypothetical protein